MNTDHLDLIAHTLDLRLESFSGNAPGHLPYVDCEFCGDRPGGGGGVDADFPLVKASDFADVMYRMDIRDLRPPRITWSGFEELIQRGRKVTGDPSLLLVPGGALGPIEIKAIGRWPDVLLDIDIASPGGLLFSQALLDQLFVKGFELPFQPTVLKDSKRRKYGYGIMQPKIYRILHSETFVRNPGYNQCAHCGAVSATRPYGNPLPKPPAHIFLHKSFRDNVDALFRVIGYEGCVFVSDRLKQALIGLRPSGFKLKPFGVWF